MRQLNFPIFETDNVVRQMASFTEDISERKQIEQTLRQNERLLDSVVNHAFFGIAALSALRDANGAIIDFEYRLVNREIAHQFRRTPAEMIGRRMFAQNPSTMTEGLFEHFVKVVETGEILDIEHSPTSSRPKQHYRISGVKLEDGLVVTYADITEQKNNQIALMQNRALLESILKNLPIGVAVASKEGKVLSVNDRYAARLKLQPDELVDRNIADFFSTDELVVWNKDSDNVLRTGQPIQSELQEIIDDHRYSLLINHFPLRDSQGQIFGNGRIAVDITEQKQIQDQLRELSKQIVEVQEKERRHIAP
jgi:PAS domain S-box-containing protein